MQSFSEKLNALIGLLLIDLLFLIPLVGLLALVAATKRPTYAVLKRNFLAYFTNPTGYVFLCLFVWLSSIAAFWPEEFFASNLANLDQLNQQLPLIMVIFIPAITMSIWAEERRQGTDELLLTMPAGDFDIVLGKYLAAVAIFTVSLLFSQIAIFLVLINLGNPDLGLFVANYFGYWMVGLALLAVGMVASFVTKNLTVGFILGVILCVPFVLAGYTDIFMSGVVAVVFRWIMLLLLPLLTILGLLASHSFAAALGESCKRFFTRWESYLLLIGYPILVAVSLFIGWKFATDHWATLLAENFQILVIPAIAICALACRKSEDESKAVRDDTVWGILGRYAAAGWIFLFTFFLAVIVGMVVGLIADEVDLTSVAVTQAAMSPTSAYWIIGLIVLAFAVLFFGLFSSSLVAYAVTVVFCLPIIYIGTAGIATGEPVGRAIRQLSVAERFTDFQAGVISLSSFIYFILLLAVMLYICMVLIGRRHWSTGRHSTFIGGHYFARAIAFLVVAGGISVAAASLPIFRWDVTSEELSSLSDPSIDLIEEVTSGEDKRVIKIEAFISQDLPQKFVQRRFDLLSALREIKAIGGDQIALRIYDGVDLFGDVANRAETYYGIEKQTVDTKVRGATTSTEAIFGVAFESQLERSIIPFLTASVPIEYELMRSLATVTQQERKKIGVLESDADLMGGSTTMRPGRQERPVIEELRKQYEVVSVNPTDPIPTDEYDVLLAVQPSSLNEAQMNNFIAAVRAGLPTAIFEDPFPVTSPAPGTSQPKRPQGMFNMQQPEQKGNIQPLWDLLGVKLVGQPASRFGGPPGDEALIIWQEYNPHPDDAELQNEFVWITPSSGAQEAFSEKSPITSGLQKLLMLYPGGMIESSIEEDREVTPLVTTGALNSGTVAYADCLEYNIIGQPYLKGREAIRSDEKPTLQQYVLAAHIKKKTADDQNAAEQGDAEKADSEAKSKPRGVNVVLVTDIDLLSGFFFELRARGEIPGMPMVAKWNLDNVTFILNLLDQLAGDDRFIEIRKRRRLHRELTAVQRVGNEAKQARNAARKEAEQRFQDAIDKAEEELNETVEELRGRTDISTQAKQEQLDIVQKNVSERVSALRAKLDREREDEFRRIENTMAAQIHNVQDRYKMLAVLLPPIPPLLIAICVFFVRRAREREGVSASRLV